MTESKEDDEEGDEEALTNPLRKAILHDEEEVLEEVVSAAKRGKFVRVSEEDKTVVDVSILGTILKGKVVST